MAKPKLKTKLYQSKILLAVFAVGFAALGTVLIHNSSAAPGGPLKDVTIHLQYNRVGGGTSWGPAGVQVSFTANNSAYLCTYGSTRASFLIGTTDGNGNVTFQACNTPNTTGSPINYYFSFAGSMPAGYSMAAGYSNNGPVALSSGSPAGQTVNEVLQQNDSDGDGVWDGADACPSQGNAGYGLQANGCPNANPNPPSNASFPTDLTVRYNPIDYGSSTSMYWSSAGATACSLERATDANPTYGAGISTPNGAQERNPGTLYVTTYFRVYCSGINGGAAAYSSARRVAVNPQPTCAQSGLEGTYPNCHTKPVCASGQTGTYPNCTTVVQPCPAGFTGTGGNCTKVVTTTTTNTRVVTRNAPAPTNSADKEKPTVPTNFTGEQVGGGEIDLSWDAATDNIGVASYTLERSTDQADWTMLDDNISGTTYADTTADYGVAYTYRLSAKDTAGNFSDYVLTDIKTNDFTANVSADEDAVITSDDGIVEVKFPAGAVSEDTYCEISKDSISGTPKGYKLVAGGYTILCKNKAGDEISKFDKALEITMHLKAYTKKYGKFAAYGVDGSNLSLIQSSFNKSSGDLTFTMKDLQTFAAFGAKKSSMLWIFILIPLLLIGLILLIMRMRGGGGGSDDYYDTTDYVSMPPTGPGSPLDTGANGYQHIPTLPEMVAGGQQPQQPQQPGPGQQQPPQYPQ
jgi:hypothetical protein